MKNIKKIFVTLSTISFLSIGSIGAVQFNQNQIVTGIDVNTATRLESFRNELRPAYEHYENILKNNSIEDLLKGTQTCECNIQQLLSARRQYALSIGQQQRYPSCLVANFGILTFKNIIKASHDEDAKTLAYYNHIITGQIGTSIVWANYFSKLLSDQKVENYILDISNSRHGFSVHIVAYKSNEQWYGINCYNSPELINGEEISDFATCLRNVSRLYVDEMQIHVDANKCPYFRNLDVRRFTKEELNNYEYEGVYVKIPKKLITGGDWNNIEVKLMNIIDKCHDSVYLRTIHPVYSMIYDLSNN